MSQKNERTPSTLQASEKTLRTLTCKEWVYIFILFYNNLIYYMDRYTLSGLLIECEEYFGVDEDLIGLMQTVYILSSMIFAPVFGYFGDRFNRKIIMGIVTIFWSCTTFTGSFMTNFWLFLLFRGIAGSEEACYITMAPPIIGDLFAGNVRMDVLAIFYIATPFGSGLGYIVGSKTAELTGIWQWGLRVTPFLGLIGAPLILFFLKNPKRGESEDSEELKSTPWHKDMKELIKNRSYMLINFAFTCVCFVAGALGWWGPKLLQLGIKIQDNQNNGKDAPFMFGLIALISGLTGVPLGCYISYLCRKRFPRADPIICGIGLIISAPLLAAAMYTSTFNMPLCYTLIYFGECTLFLNWSIVADTILVVVLPIRRGTATGFQTFLIHAFGDAGSPYIIGLLSVLFKNSKGKNNNKNQDVKLKFEGLFRALMVTIAVDLLGACLFLTTAFFILDDKEKVIKSEQEAREGRN